MQRRWGMPNRVHLRLPLPLIRFYPKRAGPENCPLGGLSRKPHPQPQRLESLLHKKPIHLPPPLLCHTNLRCGEKIKIRRSNIGSPPGRVVARVSQSEQRRNQLRNEKRRQLHPATATSLLLLALVLVPNVAISVPVATTAHAWKNSASVRPTKYCRACRPSKESLVVPAVGRRKRHL